MRRTPAAAALAVLAVSVLGCQESDPTSVEGSLVPVAPQTVEVVLSWDAFGDSVQILGGFGSVDDLVLDVVALDFRGELDARALVRFGNFPLGASVTDPSGTTRTDTLFSFLGGRVVARIDTFRTKIREPLDLSLSVLREDWHSPSATWEVKVDTVLDRTPWDEPGAGPATPVASARWDPAAGDSVVFALDSATVALFADTTGIRYSARIDMLTPGAMVEIIGFDLRLDARPSLNPDTVVVLNAPEDETTFVFFPFPEPPPDGIRAGGAPAWRTILALDVPRVLNGPSSLCDQVGCPFELTPERLNHASLVLTSRPSQPTAFQPTDSLLLDVRPVLVPERLPKAPLGPSFLNVFGLAVDPDVFGETAGVRIPITVTEFVRALLDPESADEAPSTLALLSLLEPFTIGYGDFDGPGDPGEPRLRLILTASDPVEIR
ncbi:MAG: hypothetical protein RQ751_11615 [Longimicrobiales bacterium]|nr:hypothetical protein [Longimicrobiales bacterium]